MPKTVEQRLQNLEELSRQLDRRLKERIVIPLFNSSGVVVGEVEGLQEGANVIFARSGTIRRLGTIASSGNGGGGAPTSAQYLTLAADATLTAERIFTPGTGLSGVDSGPGAAYTLNHAAVGSGDLHTEYVQESLMTTRGDLIRRGAAAPERLPVGSTRQVVYFDGTDSKFGTAFVLVNLLEGMFISGPLEAAASSSAANHQGKVIKLPSWAAAATLTGFYANVATAPTGATIKFDVCKGTNMTSAPTSLFTTTFPEIATSKNETTETGGSSGNLTGSVSAGDLLFVYVTQVGSTERGRDATVELWAKVYVEF